jgi:hypothetical protein
MFNILHINYSLHNDERVMSIKFCCRSKNVIQRVGSLVMGFRILHKRGWVNPYSNERKQGFIYRWKVTLNRFSTYQSPLSFDLITKIYMMSTHFAEAHRAWVILQAAKQDDNIVLDGEDGSLQLAHIVAVSRCVVIKAHRQFP